MKSVALMSGGKDSFLSTLTAMEQGFDVSLSLTVIPQEDSFMYHVRSTDKLMEPESDMRNRDKTVEYLSSLILQAFNLDESHGKGYIQTKLDF